MKIKEYRKYIEKIISFIIIAVAVLIRDEIDGRYALFVKGFYAFLFLYLILVSVKVIIKEFILIRNKKKEKYSYLVIFLSIIFIIGSLLLGAKNVPAVSRDIIEGKCSASLEISDQSKIVKNKLGGSRYYISGSSSNGEELLFEVSAETYINAIIINHAKMIEIEYWKYSKILCDWDIIS